MLSLNASFECRGTTRESGRSRFSLGKIHLVNIQRSVNDPLNIRLGFVSKR